MNSNDNTVVVLSSNPNHTHKLPFDSMFSRGIFAKLMQVQPANETLQADTAPAGDLNKQSAVELDFNHSFAA